jgi:outer membrane protein assembly factor BamB
MDEFTPNPAHEDVTVLDLIYHGFNARVVAMHRDTGEVVWVWKSSHWSGFPSLLLDNDRLVVSISGYTYCLDAVTGELMWENALKGHGTGIPSLVSIYGNSGSVAAAALIAQQNDSNTGEGGSSAAAAGGT